MMFRAALKESEDRILSLKDQVADLEGKLTIVKGTEGYRYTDLEGKLTMVKDTEGYRYTDLERKLTMVKDTEG